MTSPASEFQGSLRIVDANLDRIGEGLRLLEDIARFRLNNSGLTRQLKEVRHRLITIEPTFKRQLLDSRRASTDIGRDIEAPGQTGNKDLSSLITANAQRVEQSLRVVEELAKIPDIPLGAQTFKQARFALYHIEKQLQSGLLRRDKAARISGLYVIIDTPSLGGRRHAEVARQTIKGGASVVQLRDKTLPASDRLAIAGEIRDICRQYNVLFIVNNYLDIALATDADGLHLGQNDLPMATARRLLPMNKLLGCSVENVAQARTAAAEGADYLAAGAIYATDTKKDISVIGLKGFSAIKRAVKIPVVAIGGINQENIAEVTAAGADAVAVIGAVAGATSPREAAAQMVERLKKR